MLFHSKRSERGASTIVLILILAFLVILPLGLLGFEIARLMLVQAQLRSVTDSAALSGTAAMASAPETLNYTQREQLAMTTAQVTFEQNSVMQTAFNTGNVTANQNPMPPTPQTPTLHHAALNIILLDQNGAQVATGQPAATMTVQSFYTEQPIFTSFILPIQQQYVAAATANGGLPLLDIMLCFDVSGSMDDQTNIQMINRYWDTTAKTVMYTTATSPTGQVGHGLLYNVFTPPPTGTGFNVFPPQNMSYASYPLPTGNGNTFLWSETPGPFIISNLNGLRSNITQYPPGPASMPEQGMPPGNYDKLNPNVNYNGLNPTSQDASGGFTDTICDMGFPTSFNGFSFPGPEAAVEASRGNLESVPILKSACPGTLNGNLPAPSPGYFNAYWTWVLQNASPIGQARTAAYNFFNIMNTSANSHFALETFSDAAGTSSSGVWTGKSANNKNIDAAYLPGGTGIFPMPLITLDQTASNFSNVTNAINGSPLAVSPLVGEGQTDIADALSEGLKELTNKALYRPTAKRAIVLFTDGVPNQPGNSQGAAQAAAFAVAANARANGIPIYCIGLSQNPNLIAQESSFLGDGNNGTGNGVAARSGNGAIFVSVTNAAQLDQAFQTIARSLCVLQ